MSPSGLDASRARITLVAALSRARSKVGGAREIIEDHDRKPLTYDTLFRAMFALGGPLGRMTAPKERVGVMLPTGVGCTVTLLALVAAGRVPAMINFSAGAANVVAACAVAGVRRVLTSRRFVDQAKLEDLVRALPAEIEVTYLEDVRGKLTLSDKLGALVKAAAPETFAASASPDDPAVILFTSGSFGAPRGVVLSHANLVANAYQAATHIPFESHWVFCNPLPMFHALGLTAGTLLPLVTGHKAALYPSPLHFKEVPKFVAATGAHVLFATDTFACQYIRAGGGADLSSLVFAVLGAERVREETRALYERAGVLLLEGYGCTECAPVLSVNKPDANKPGTVGSLLPWIEARLEEIPGVEEGRRLYVRGPNVMLGYLGEDGALEPPVDGWHDTGDVATLDAEGFLKIHGRVKRFAKVAGEMVSLAAVENYAAAVWPEHRHAAVALPDPRRGERVVLVTDNPAAEPEHLQAWLRANGAPEIAAPRKVVKLPELPVLGSGKTDYVAVKQVAETLDRAEAA